MIGSGKNSINLKKIGYLFKDINILELALTHSSLNSLQNNQRLEFLGDAILNFIIADYLYEKIPNIAEGELTRLRSCLVQGETLALIAKVLELEQAINLGLGEIKSGGVNKNSILADTVEALIAAIYLDSNLTTVSRIIIAWYTKLNYFNIDGSINMLHQELLPGKKDAKTMLQELLHSKGFNPPSYAVLSITGKPHKQIFKVSCAVSGMPQVFYGEGSSRKRAEQAAAKKFLEVL